MILRYKGIWLSIEAPTVVEGHYNVSLSNWNAIKHLEYSTLVEVLNILEYINGEII